MFAVVVVVVVVVVVGCLGYVLLVVGMYV